MNKKELLIFITLLVIGNYLFFKTFGYDTKTSQFLIASNVYLDFGSHIPFMRSFSMGQNFPAEVPFFAGEKLTYHFMFDLYAGILEYLGLRIDFAFNLVSTLSFASLFFYIYRLSGIFFKNNTYVPLLTILLCLFSSNLSFIKFFQNNKLDFNIFSSFWHSPFFLDNSNVPFSGNFVIAEFWNLNTFFNQRHFIFALLFAVFIIYTLLVLDSKQDLKFKKILFLSLMIGLFPFWHSMIFLAIYILLSSLFIINPSLRKFILTLLMLSTIIALPEIFAIKMHSSNQVIFKPGFLTNENLTLLNFAKFWFYNLGFSIFTLALGFIMSSKKQKKIFIVFMILFIVPNLFQFSNRFVFDDHKFFNLWIYLINMFSAYAIYLIYKKNIIGKLVSIFFLFILTFSGLLSIIVTKNDVYSRIQDYPGNSFLAWSVKNIPKNSILVTNGEIYDPVSLIGRKTIMGRAHYIYIYGGNPNEKLYQQEKILLGKDFINKNNINYLIIYKNDFAKNSKKYNLEAIEIKYKKIYDDKYAVVFKI